MSVEIKWRTGGRGTIVRCDGERVSIDSAVPAPPGSTLQGLGPADFGCCTIKVRACRRSGGGFAIDGRLVNPSRMQLERLASRCGGPG